MTSQEFKAWFEGFTCGKKKLSAGDLRTARLKLEGVWDPIAPIAPWPVYVPQWWIAYPVYPWDTTTVTLDPGLQLTSAGSSSNGVFISSAGGAGTVT